MLVLTALRTVRGYELMESELLIQRLTCNTRISPRATQPGSLIWLQSAGRRRAGFAADAASSSKQVVPTGVAAAQIPAREAWVQDNCSPGACEEPTGRVTVHLTRRGELPDSHRTPAHP